jgi:hypothetical protein
VNNVLHDFGDRSIQPDVPVAGPMGTDDGSLAPVVFVAACDKNSAADSKARGRGAGTVVAVGVQVQCLEFLEKGRDFAKDGASSVGSRLRGASGRSHGGKDSLFCFVELMKKERRKSR